MRCLGLLLVGLSSLALSGVSLLDAAQPDVAPLELCLAAAADNSPVYPTRTFPPTMKELTAVFKLGAGESFSKLTATWVAVDVGSAAPPNYQIAIADLRLERKRQGKFTYSQPNPLPIGKYRLDVKADSKPWQSVEFTVAGAAALEIAKPTDLLPLAKGQIWTYALLQEAGGPARITKPPPGATLDADGKLRATVTFAVIGTDEKGTHLELRRGDVRFSEEWWRLGAGGLTVTQRRLEGKSIVLDPPQTLLPWPLKPPQTWVYEALDKSLKQTYHVWGPVPVKGPRGEAPGLVALTQEESQPTKTTVERHFLPGVGMVRSIGITALGDEMISREELVLR